MAALTFAKLSNELLSQKDGSQQIDRQVDVAMVQIDPWQRAVLKYGGAVDQRCHFTKFCGRFKHGHRSGAAGLADPH